MNKLVGVGHAVSLFRWIEVSPKNIYYYCVCECEWVYSIWYLYGCTYIHIKHRELPRIGWKSKCVHKNAAWTNEMETYTQRVCEREAGGGGRGRIGYGKRESVERERERELVREKCEGKKSHFLVCLQCHRKMDSDRNWIFFLLAVSLTFNGILFCGELSQWTVYTIIDLP